MGRRRESEALLRWASTQRLSTRQGLAAIDGRVTAPRSTAGFYVFRLLTMLICRNTGDEVSESRDGEQANSDRYC